MILTGQGIRDARGRGEIDVDPWDDSRVNPNSYNVRLGNKLIMYIPGGGFAPQRGRPRLIMDLRHPPEEGREILIPETGYILEPGVLYLGHTMERTRSGPPWVPLLEGRSSVGRRGLAVHVSAGFGDVGFDGQWTFELSPLLPIRVYAGAEIAQVYFVRTEGDVKDVYAGRYQGQSGPVPAR